MLLLSTFCRDIKNSDHSRIIAAGRGVAQFFSLCAFTNFALARAPATIMLFHLQHPLAIQGYLRPVFPLKVDTLGNFKKPAQKRTEQVRAERLHPLQPVRIDEQPPALRMPLPQNRGQDQSKALVKDTLQAQMQISHAFPKLDLKRRIIHDLFSVLSVLKVCHTART
jgi:hypothetical protein